VTRVTRIGRAALLLVGAALAALAAVATPSCSVNRRSSGYACDNNSDCDVGRLCSRGYCIERGGPEPVPGGCPSGCTTCDLEEQTCDIDCSEGTRCTIAQCPPGFDCTIRCMAPGGCTLIDCSAAASCEITCSGVLACQNITCGPGACDVDCIGTGACGLLDCRSSCRCDQFCRSPTSCASSSCPITQTEVCTEDGEDGTPCDSSTGSDCDQCP
jgi:hypothetical protein